MSHRPRWEHDPCLDRRPGWLLERVDRERVKATRGMAREHEPPCGARAPQRATQRRCSPSIRFGYLIQQGNMLGNAAKMGFERECGMPRALEVFASGIVRLGYRERRERTGNGDERRESIPQSLAAR